MIRKITISLPNTRLNNTDNLALESPLGILRLSASNKGITEINYHSEEKPEKTTHRENNSNNPHLKIAVRELSLYFEGKLEHFITPLDLKGTPFQISVWNALSNIPFGVSTHYGEIAERIGNPGSSRAVGMANNRNPISIIVPCHRVIGRDGKLIGYGGGIWRKEWLLKHEDILL